MAPDPEPDQSMFPGVFTTRLPSFPSNLEPARFALAPTPRNAANAVTASATSTRLIPPSPFRVDCREDPNVLPEPLQARFLPIRYEPCLVLRHPLQDRHEHVVAKEPRGLWIEAHEDGEILHVHVQHVSPAFRVVRDEQAPRLRRTLRQPVLCLRLLAPLNTPTGRAKTFFTPHSSGFWLGVYESLITERPVIPPVPVRVKLPPLEQPESLVPRHLCPVPSWASGDPGVVSDAHPD